jgi:peptide/nickel transport system permease protein
VPCSSGLLGVVVGLTRGYLGGKIDAVLMRIADIQLSFPYLMVAIFISAIFQVAFGIGRYEDLAVPLADRHHRAGRMAGLRTHGACLGYGREKSKEYVEAARVIGLNRRIMFRHVLPNTMTSVLVISTIQVANAIMSEAALSFLGLGMPVTKPSLGSLIRSGFEYIFSGSWWITLFPGVLLVLLVLVINSAG